MKQPREAKTATRSAELQKTFGAPMGRKHIIHPMAKTRNEVRCPASGTVNWLTSAFHLDVQCLVCLRSRAEQKKPTFLRLVLEALSHATPADRFCFSLTAPGVTLLYPALHVSFGLGKDP